MVPSYSKTELRLLLRTSEGFPAQSYKARVDAGKLVPKKLGHAIEKHVAGAAEPLAETEYKTKFCSVDGMVEAFELLLKTPRGVQVLRALAPGMREPVEADIPRAFEIEADLRWTPPVRVKFDQKDIARAGRTTTRCVAILEGRLRDGRTHLHVQSFFPKVSPAELETLIDVKTRP